MERRAPLQRGRQLQRGGQLGRGGQRGRIKPVSAKQARVQRERRKLAGRFFPGEAVCAVPGCGRAADDLHEPLTRARGGDPTDLENVVPLCREHHDEITFKEPPWAYELGLLRHSWDKPKEDRP